MSSVGVTRNNRLYFDFVYQGVRCREFTTLPDTLTNRRRMHQALRNIDERIADGSFEYAAVFPTGRHTAEFRSDPMPTTSPQLLHPVAHVMAAPSFEDFAEQWFLERAATWKRSYRQKLSDIHRVFLQPHFGARPMNQITRSELLIFRANLRQGGNGRKPLSASRTNQIVHLMRQILQEAAERYGFTHPFSGIKPLREDRRPIDPFSLEEVERFLAVVDPDWHAYYTVRFFTGMRTGEIDGLKWRYVDFNRREILIRETRVRGERETPKTGSSERAIQMSDTVHNALCQHKATVGDRSDHVFSTVLGFPLSYSNVSYRIWYPTLAKAEIVPRNPYQTRHTAATLWLAAGESPEWIARQMGHANTRMLFSIYSRFVPNLTRRDGSAIDALLQQRFGSAPAKDALQESGHA
ncbi:DUF3596 domain-containing protein [Algiphilus sp. NNCM1]|uniref:site-specific integrase n=1 Tax=Algiphilus sp. TaxID=1872431 RepID=UPI001CA6FA9D|nr:site-specific integrase [Algiphilus sp.]MBY8965016.1 DUF3596 domain-containing protein [Algiphilus acroporae]MCI5104172.1 site-specific integrase [Algiphilus sp.]